MKPTRHNLEIQNPDRGRKPQLGVHLLYLKHDLEIQNPDRGRKLIFSVSSSHNDTYNLEIQNPDRGRKQYNPCAGIKTGLFRNTEPR